MANPNQSEKSVALDREENITKGNLSAKKVALYTYDAGSDTLSPVTSLGSSSSSSDQLDILNDINEAVSILSAVRGSSADLRATILSGSIAITSGTVTTVTTVTTVSTVTNQAQMGGIATNQQIPALTNMIAQSNIDRITIS